MVPDEYDAGALPRTQESPSPFSMSSLSSENSSMDATKSDSSSDRSKSALQLEDSTSKGMCSCTIPTLCRQSSASFGNTMHGSIPSTLSLPMDPPTTTSPTAPRKTPDMSLMDLPLKKRPLDMDKYIEELDVEQVRRYDP